MSVVRLSEITREEKRSSITKTWDWLFQKGFVSDNKLTPLQYKNVNGAWIGQPCYVIGAGPPLKDFLNIYGWEFFNGKHTIGINHIIEDYDQFEWFFFLDKRFIEKTTYDLNNFKSRIFAQNNTGLEPKENVTLFTCRIDRPGEKIEDGLYSPNFSALAALNLALISGANPIYLIGYGMGREATADNYHFKKDYTANAHSVKRFQKYIDVQKFYDKFKQFSNRIICVTDGDDMVQFKHITPNGLFKTKQRRNRKLIVEGRKPIIAHLSFTDDINKMGDVSRHIINKCFGKHILFDYKKGIPNADLYILEHFISTHKACVEFPYKQKAIDIVHTVNCIPQGAYAKIIALTNSWKKVLEKNYVENIDVIYGGIDLDPYATVVPDYSNSIFGRITRWSPGKIHPEWNKMLLEIFEQNKKISCLMFVDFVNMRREKLNHNNMIYDESVKIFDFKGNALKKLSLYVHVNGTFKETMSHAVIEAMATGLPVIYLTEKTGVLEEVVGSAGIRCETLAEVKENILRLIVNKDEKERLGKIAREQAKKFDVNETVNKFDKLIKELIHA